MKKVIAILAVLMLVACVVFADATIKVRSKVTTTQEEENPQFTLKAGLTKAAMTVSAIDGDSATMGTTTQQKSIKTDDIILYFQIVQVNNAGKNGSAYIFTITPSEMIQIKDANDADVEATNAHKTTPGVVSEKAENQQLVNATVTPKNDAEKFDVAYTGKVAENTVLASFTVTWASDENAPDGLYEASVVVNFETV